MIKSLKHLGLTDNDGKVYMTLVDIGITKTGPLILKSGVVSSRVYSSLDKLEKLGLVSSFLRNNVRFYKPEPPTQFLADLEDQSKDLTELSRRIEKTIERNAFPGRVAVYEGERGYRQAFLQHVSNIKPKSELHIIAYGGVFKSDTEKRNFFKRIDKVMISRQGSAKMIIDKSLQAVMEHDREFRKAYELRILPSRYFGGMGVNITEQEVMLSSIGNEPIAVILRDQNLINSYEKQFSLLWNIAQTVKNKPS